jgi:hypothetical protein
LNFAIILTLYCVICRPFAPVSEVNNIEVHEEEDIYSNLEEIAL